MHLGGDQSRRRKLNDDRDWSSDLISRNYRSTTAFIILQTDRARILAIVYGQKKSLEEWYILLVIFVETVRSPILDPNNKTIHQ